MIMHMACRNLDFEYNTALHSLHRMYTTTSAIFGTDLDIVPYK